MCFIEELFEIVEERRREAPQGSYVARLMENEDLLLEKLGEEAVEVILASKDDLGVVHEVSDLIFHSLVLLSSSGHDLEEVEEELLSRHEARGEDG